MKKYILIILLLIPFIVYSQSACLKIKLGPSFPLGDYGVVDYESSAYAKPGGSFALTGEWKFWKNLGVKGSVNYIFNPIESYQIAVDFNTAYPNMSHIVQSGSYKIYSFMGGMVYSIEIGKLFSIDLYAMAGYSIFGDPGTRIEGSTVSTFDYHRFESYSANTSSISLLAGTDFNIKLNKRFDIGLGLSYFGTTAKFRNVGLVVEEYLVTTIGTRVRTMSWDYNVQILNFDVGLKVAIGKVD